MNERGGKEDRVREGEKDGVRGGGRGGREIE